MCTVMIVDRHQRFLFDGRDEDLTVRGASFRFIICVVGRLCTGFYFLLSGGAAQFCSCDFRLLLLLSCVRNYGSDCFGLILDAWAGVCIVRFSVDERVK